METVLKEHFWRIAKKRFVRFLNVRDPYVALKNISIYKKVLGFKSFDATLPWKREDKMNGTAKRFQA
jgi:hypothetical protein